MLQKKKNDQARHTVKDKAKRFSWSQGAQSTCFYDSAA